MTAAEKGFTENELETRVVDLGAFTLAVAVIAAQPAALSLRGAIQRTDTDHSRRAVKGENFSPAYLRSESHSGLGPTPYPHNDG